MRYFTHILIAILLSMLQLNCDSGGLDDARIQKGKFRATLTETGELLAVNSRVITVPFSDWDIGKAKLVWLEKEGTTVQAGHVIALLDTSAYVRELGQKKADLAIAKADLNKMLAQHESQRRNLQAALASAQASFSQAVIDTERVKFESATRRELEILKLSKTKIHLQTAKSKIEHTAQIQKEELMIQHEKINQILAAIAKAERNIKQFTIRAPANGMIEYYKDRHSGRKIQISDEFWPGRPLIGLPDLSRIKVKSQINETDITKIALGQPVLVRLDAYPKKEFHGSIVDLGIICYKKDRDSDIKVFDIEILIEESDLVLRPGMTVSCEIVTADLAEALYVANDYVIQERNKFYIHCKSRSGYKKVPVTLGPRNSKAVVIDGNVKAGQKLVKPERRGTV